MEKEFNIGFVFTTTALKQMIRIFEIDLNCTQVESSEFIIKYVFGEELFDCYFQNATRVYDENTRVRILIASDTENSVNSKFIKKNSNRILAMEVRNINKYEVLLLNVRLLPMKVGSNSNKSIHSKVRFSGNHDIKYTSLPEDLINNISKMPNAEEVYKKVEKNIKDWDNYLSIIEANALESQLDIKYIGYKQEDELTQCIFSFNSFNNEEIIKLKRFRNDKVILYYKKCINKDENKEIDSEDSTHSKNEIITEIEEITTEQDSNTYVDVEDFIGTIERVNFKKHTIKINLEPEFYLLAQKNKLDFPNSANLRITKMGDLAQARNLRHGLSVLKNGGATNPDLDILLFNSKTVSNNVTSNVNLSKDTLLLDTLNNKQKEAVEGVVNAKDIFLIQGPPGTGKTTVIAEICYQNALCGKKTLIASQSNLAVDNALSRLVHSPKIRIIREGAVSRVEKEGEKYIEGNVVKTWLNKTANSCKSKLEKQVNYLYEILDLEYKSEDISNKYREIENIKCEIKRGESIINNSKVELQCTGDIINKLNENLNNIQWEIWDSKNIYGYLSENTSIRNMKNIVTNLISSEIVDKILNGKNSCNFKLAINKFNNIIDNIYDEIVDNFINQRNINIYSILIEEIKSIIYSINTRVIPSIEDITNKREKTFDNIYQYIELHQQSILKNKEICYSIATYKDYKSRLLKCNHILSELKNNHFMKRILIPSKRVAENITDNEIIYFEDETERIFNNKPNKFTSLMGLKREWKIQVITNLDKIDETIKILNSKIDDLENNFMDLTEQLELQVSMMKQCCVELLDNNFQTISEIKYINEINNTKVEKIYNLICDYPDLKSSLQNCNDVYTESINRFNIESYKNIQKIKSTIDKFELCLIKVNDKVNTDNHLKFINNYKNFKVNFKEIFNYEDSIPNKIIVKDNILVKDISNLKTQLYKSMKYYNSKVEYYESNVEGVVNNISRANIKYQKIKKLILNPFNLYYQSIQHIISSNERSIERNNKTIVKLTSEINEYNLSINATIGLEINYCDVEKFNDIEAYYKKLVEPKKIITYNYVNIIGEWIEKINKNDFGREVELRDMYVKNTNVVGITCVQAGKRDFSNKYGNFDVVIVDEVSKATPPELVLPLLKGKKIVLVGDHKQLPPMIGSETFDELKEKKNKEVVADCDTKEFDYMKKSLFEELFLNIEDSNKIMLNTQYRMHSSIMKTINQFYVEEGSNGLICGVKNEEEVKKHNIETKYINSKNNILWVDIPLHKKYSESFDNNKSCYNTTEIEVIEKIVKDINNSCETLKETKNVAVITFYSAQARLLQKNLITKNKYDNINLRIGTVDRFQGIEREIVIVSFVRNNTNRNIGFARDPKRINVALSRAQKLLIIVGCSELFCESNSFTEARECYQNVLKVVDSYDGIINANDVFN